jgi:hypothetical protein
MIDVKRGLYNSVLKLHPAAFRNEFANEMVLDFEDALHSYSLAALYLDALISLARQWMLNLFVESAEQRSVGRISLLAGHYVMVPQGELTLLELMRGLVLSVLLFTAFWSTESPVRSETFRCNPDIGRCRAMRPRRQRKVWQPVTSLSAMSR